VTGSSERTVDSGHRRQALLRGQWTQVTGSSERTVDTGDRLF
jgi:hypothetical protein